jgi:hypothetical protein
MEEIKYLNEEDVRRRLDRTIVRYKDKVVLCVLIGGTVVRLKNCSNGRVVIDTDANDPDIDIGSPPLGYVFGGDNGAFYVSRLPVRKYQQGISTANVKIEKDDNPIQNMHLLIPQDMFQGFTLKQLTNTILGEYPSYKDALKNIRAGSPAIPFSRRYCISRQSADTILLRHRTNTIGVVDRDGTVLLNPDTVLSLHMKQLGKLGVNVI